MLPTRAWTEQYIYLLLATSCLKTSKLLKLSHQPACFTTFWKWTSSYIESPGLQRNENTDDQINNNALSKEWEFWNLKHGHDLCFSYYEALEWKKDRESKVIYLYYQCCKKMCIKRLPKNFQNSEPKIFIMYFVPMQKHATLPQYVKHTI